MTLQQTAPNVHKVLQAISELEKLPEVKAYITLMASLKDSVIDSEEKITQGKKS